MVKLGGTDSADHERARISAERVLQDAREFGVSVGHVRPFAVGQLSDDVAQGRQRQIDVDGLLESHRVGKHVGLRLTLGTCDKENRCAERRLKNRNRMGILADEGKW